MLAPFEMTKHKMLQKYAGREVIRENVGFDEWKRMSMARQVPVNAVWAAALGIIYGPERKAAE